MHQVPAYDYAAVIAYNTARVPGLGSAIFLHVGTGTATAGCVSLPRAELIKVLRWLKPGDNPRISVTVRLSCKHMFDYSSYFRVEHDIMFIG